MFRYYNANPLGRHVNDCTVRAISLATNKSWDESFEELSRFAQAEAITFSEVEFINEYLSKLYPRWCQDQKINRLKDFLELNLKGRYLITMSGHITCVIDGVCYDTFDPSEKFIWCIYKVF